MLRFAIILILIALTLPTFAAPQWEALVSSAGQVRLSRAGKVVGTLEPGLFEAVWRFVSVAPPGKDAVAAGPECRGQIRAPGGTVVDSLLKCAVVPDGLHLIYTLTPRQEIKLNSLHVSLGMPAAACAGGQFTADGKALPFPAALDKAGLYSAPTKELALAFPGGARLNFACANPTPVLVQDDRQWSDAFSVRIGPQYGQPETWPAGKALVIDLTLTAPGGMAVEYDGPVTITAGPEWLPLDYDQDIVEGSALDFSSLVPWHVPAGKLGRVIADKAGHFVFEKEPGVPARFYGCNLCFSGQYLTHEQADKLAVRLQRLGYNAVRFHHYERDLVDRKGGTSTELNPDAMDKLDYLAAALAKRGIYYTTDLYVSRPVFASEVWKDATGDVDMNEFKMAVLVNEDAYANYLSFATHFLNHPNPYTGRRWADDPALAWLCLVNEGNAGNYIGSLSPRLKADYTRAWNAWLAQRYPDRAKLEAALGAPPAEGGVPLPQRLDESQQGRLLAAFLADAERSFFINTSTYLRQIMKCKALLTDMNGWSNPLIMQAVRVEFDYVDDHFYVDHPQFIERPWQLPSRSPNTSPVADGAPGGRHCAFVREFGKPFALSEFNYAAPGRFRGVGGMLTAAMGALQDWSVIWRFAYSHTREGVAAPRPLSYFDLAGDPLNQAADRAGAFLFRRGDLAPAPHAVSITLTPAVQAGMTRFVNPSWNGLALVTRVGTEVLATPAKKPLADIALSGERSDKTPNIDPFGSLAGKGLLDQLQGRGWVTADNPTDLKTRYRSETGELTVDGPADVFTLDTPRTQGGYAPAGGKIETANVTITIGETGATVWASSLDGKPIRDSRRLLITHLTDVQDTNARYADRARTVLLAWGSLPYLARAGTATVTLRLAHPEKATVYGLATNGARTGQIPAKVVNGALTIPLTIDNNGKARLLYEVEVAE